MNKQNLIIGIIILIALVGGVVLWNQKNNQENTKQQTKKEVVKQTQEQKTAKEQNNQDQNQKQEMNKGQEESQEQNIKHLSPEEIEKLKKEKDLVWYEIPELGIKFLVTRDIAKIIGYRDFYVMDTKGPGKELFIKRNDVNDKIAFAKIIEYLNYSKNNNLKWMINCVGNTCCPVDKNIGKLLLKTKSKIVCYLDEGGSIANNILKNEKDLKVFLGTIQQIK